MNSIQETRHTKKGGHWPPFFVYIPLKINPHSGARSALLHALGRQFVDVARESRLGQYAQ